jgi:hypothetical protein
LFHFTLAPPSEWRIKTEKTLLFAHEQKKVSIQQERFTSFCLGPFGSEQNLPRIITVFGCRSIK